MSMRNTFRALPTMMRIGFSEAIAYRAEMFIWILSTTMPFIMMAMWSAVAVDGPVGRYDQPKVVAYFLCTFIARQITGAWAAWQINFEIRQGVLSQRLLRPVSPVVGFMVENLGAMPLRIVVVGPVLISVFLLVGEVMPRSVAIWGLALLAMIGGWALNFFINVLVGALAFFMENSSRLMEIWLAGFFVFSGYLIPIDLFPDSLRTLAEWLPFRNQIGLPVELMTGKYENPADAFAPLLRQWVWVLVIASSAVAVWKSGVKRFAAFGG